MHVAVHFVSYCKSHDAQHDFQAHAVLQSGLQGCDRDYSTVLLLVLAVAAAARDTLFSSTGVILVLKTSHSWEVDTWERYLLTHCHVTCRGMQHA
jgi:hypothetical protein